MVASQPVGLLAAMLSVTLCFGVMYPTRLLAAESPAQVSPDGLQLTKSAPSSVVYIKPGATFGQYTKVAILDCFVEFDKNWQSHYNSQQVVPSNQVSASDMSRIKTELAGRFKKIFTHELAKGGYTVVDSAAPDVLVLRPALINLRVTQPDLMTPGMSMTLIRSAGSATLYLELYDSVSSTLLARALSAKADQNGGQIASGVSNTRAADILLKQWADNLRSKLEAARSTQ